MVYPFQQYGQQPFQYQDQLSQLRGGTMVPAMQYPPQRQESGGLNWVQGEAGAKSWIVTPGATVLLMDSEAQKFYLKSADQSGVPSMRIFEYTETTNSKPAEAQKPAQFVTVDEFNTFKSQITEMIKKDGKDGGEDE